MSDTAESRVAAREAQLLAAENGVQLYRVVDEIVPLRTWLKRHDMGALDERLHEAVRAAHDRIYPKGDEG